MCCEYKSERFFVERKYMFFVILIFGLDYLFLLSVLEKFNLKS